MAAKTAAAAAWFALALLAGTCSPFTMPRRPPPTPAPRRRRRRAGGGTEAHRAHGGRRAAGRPGEIQTLVFEGDYVVHYERGVCQYAGRLQERDDDDGDGGGDGELPILLRFADRTVALEHREASRLTRLRGSDETVAVRSSGSSSPRTGPRRRAAGLGSERRRLAVGVQALSKWSKPEVWRGKRDRAEAASRDHARDLLTLRGARSSRARRGVARPSAASAALLEAGLGYELTAGQRQCWEDVEEDMCRRLAPMDRLVFGDVGFRGHRPPGSGVATKLGTTQRVGASEPGGDDGAEDPSGGAIAVAHGRVDDPAAVVADFAAGDNETRPVLLATTLVENCPLTARRRRRLRLSVIAGVDAKSGPELARRDLEIRGAGALLGTRQSGRASRDVGDEMCEARRGSAVEALGRGADRGCDASHLPAALEQRAAGDADAEAALARVRGAPTLEACQRRRQGASGPARRSSRSSSASSSSTARARLRERRARGARLQRPHDAPRPARARG
ncbi:helicase [Aureococcus anophagefferens]|nr:helicase [Aureococcus anophagefferens]